MTGYFYRPCVLTIMTILISQVSIADTIPVNGSGSIILKEKISIRLEASFTDNFAGYPVILFGISKGQGQMVTLIADHGPDNDLVFYLTGRERCIKSSPASN